jgi:hypothetical protein
MRYVFSLLLIFLPIGVFASSVAPNPTSVANVSYSATSPQDSVGVFDISGAFVGTNDGMILGSSGTFNLPIQGTYHFVFFNSGTIDHPSYCGWNTINVNTSYNNCVNVSTGGQLMDISLVYGSSSAPTSSPPYYYNPPTTDYSAIHLYAIPILFSLFILSMFTIWIFMNLIAFVFILGIGVFRFLYNKFADKTYRGNPFRRL